MALRHGDEQGYADKKGQWKEVANLANVQDGYTGAYLDLFPIKHTELGDFEKIFRNHADIRATMLRITHERMVSLRPKVIVNLFAMTAYYWGQLFFSSERQIEDK